MTRMRRFINSGLRAVVTVNQLTLRDFRSSLAGSPRFEGSHTTHGSKINSSRVLSRATLGLSHIANEPLRERGLHSESSHTL
jgi:hypothetical protein